MRTFNARSDCGKDEEKIHRVEQPIVRKVGRYASAATAFERALEIGPETGGLQFALAAALWKVGDDAKAAPHAKRAVQLGDRKPGVPVLIEELTRAGFLAGY